MYYPFIDEATTLAWQLEPELPKEMFFIHFITDKKHTIECGQEWQSITNRVPVLLDILTVQDGIHTPSYYRNELPRWCPWLPANTPVIHTNHAYPTGYYDFLFNRQKAFFTDYKTEWQTHWTMNSSSKSFVLTPLPVSKPITRTPLIFPNRIYPKDVSIRMTYRYRLNEYMLENRIRVLRSPLDPEWGVYTHSFNSSNSSVWKPIANDIYNKTYASVYVESLVGHETLAPFTRSITEKTWDPLIKGHFILPFSYPGIIQDLRTIYGVEFPPEIDYSYDQILDREQRFEQFCRELRRLRKMRWDQLYLRHRDILAHNRQMFWDRPYHKLPIKR